MSRPPRHHLLLAVLLAGCSGSSGRSPESDFDRLQGTWEAKTGDRGELTALMKIEGRRFAAQLSKDSRELAKIRGVVRLNENANPRTFDAIEDGKTEPTYFAIYKMGIDSFTICTGTAQSGRPSEFKQGEKGWPALKVYKRVGEEAGAALSTAEGSK